MDNHFLTRRHHHFGWDTRVRSRRSRHSSGWRWHAAVRHRGRSSHVGVMIGAWMMVRRVSRVALMWWGPTLWSVRVSMRRITLLLRRPLWWVPVLNWITLGVRLRWWGIGWLLVLFRARHWDVRGRSVVHWRVFWSFRAWHLGWQLVGWRILDCDRIGLLRGRALV